MKTQELLDRVAKAKANFPDHLVFVRIGDFYEAVNEDAKVVSKALGITLSRRSNEGPDKAIAMCGIPVHASHEWFAALRHQGHKVVAEERS